MAVMVVDASVIMHYLISDTFTSAVKAFFDQVPSKTD